MGKKRKASGRPYGGGNSPKDEDSKMRITTFEDVADSEDEFHLNRDKILLDEGPAAKKMRKWREQDKFLQPSDEEVLGYDDASEEDAEGYEEFGDHDAQSDDFEPSKREHVTDDGDEDLGIWGPSKKDYYNADAIETEQDALDEEAEARRIQQKQLQAMTEADFGFDEDEWLGEKDGDKVDFSGKVVTEVLPQLQITSDMTEEDKLKILHSRYPEFEHIRQEFLRLQPIHDELKAAADVAERLAKSRTSRPAKVNGTLAPTMAVHKYRACASYLGAICMYFAILTSTAKEDDSQAIAMDPTELHEHPVMECLLKCQRTWTKVEKLPVADPVVNASNSDELSVIEEASPAPDPQAKLNEAIARKRKEKKLKKSKAQLAAEAVRAESDARRAEKLSRTEKELAGLSALTNRSALRKAAAKQKEAQQQPKLNLLNPDDSDFGEETSLTMHELAEKAKKKKSLRFYTSQIAQKVNKRGAAGKDYSGDVDVPHRERLKDRQARLQAAAEKRGQNKDSGPGVALGEGGDDSGDSDARAPTPEDDYYAEVVARSNAKKKAKEERATAYALAAKENATVVPEETVGADGKRKITYNILKNKGLMPKRKKEVRNPRVKKKLKYADKQKKLASRQQVYRGGEGRGNYGGELTGIKSNLIRSTKL